MCPRHSAAEARRTRRTILESGVALASVRGVSRVSAADIAGDTGLSRAGVIGPFGSMGELQLAVLREGAQVFLDEVWRPVADLPAGRARLQATMESWISYHERRVFPGGCLLSTAAVEFDALEGPVRDLVLKMANDWQAVLAGDAEVAVRAGELPPGTDPAQIAFELYGIALMLNQGVVLQHDRRAPLRAWAAVERVLGLRGGRAR